jgi:hypothetical protein
MAFAGLMSMKGRGSLVMWERVLAQLHQDMKPYDQHPDSVVIPPEIAKHEQDILREDILPKMLASGELKVFYLDKCLYVKGLWYSHNADHIAECASKIPSVLNNNWIVGNQEKINRAQAHKHWFLNGETCLDWNTTLEGALQTFKAK